MEALMSIFTLSYLFVRDAGHTLVCIVGLLSRNIVFGVQSARIFYKIKNTSSP